MTILRTSIRPRIGWVYHISPRVQLPLWRSSLRPHADDSICWVRYHSRLEPQFTFDHQCHSPCPMSGGYIIRCRAHDTSASVSEFLTGWWTRTSLCPSDYFDTRLYFSVSAAIYPDRYTDNLSPDTFADPDSESSSHRGSPKSRVLPIRSGRGSVSPPERPSEWRPRYSEKCHGNSSG